MNKRGMRFVEKRPFYAGYYDIGQLEKTLEQIKQTLVQAKAANIDLLGGPMPDLLVVIIPSASCPTEYGKQSNVM
jgi:hypothetical protein